jgi:hypothetical protein
MAGSLEAEEWLKYIYRMETYILAPKGEDWGGSEGWPRLDDAMHEERYYGGTSLGDDRLNR